MTNYNNWLINYDSISLTCIIKGLYRLIIELKLNLILAFVNWFSYLHNNITATYLNVLEIILICIYIISKHNI